MFSFCKRSVKKLDGELDKSVTELNGKRIVVWISLFLFGYIGISFLGTTIVNKTHEQIWEERRIAESEQLSGHNYRTYYPRAEYSGNENN